MNTEIFLSLIPLLFGAFMIVVNLVTLTKKFEDQYDKKTKEIAIVYDDKFQKEIEIYIKKKNTTKDYEILQEELNYCKEKIMKYANEYYEWMEKSKETKKLLRKTALYFLLGGILGFIATIIYLYAIELFPFILMFDILIFALGFGGLVDYIRIEGYIDEKYNEYELGRIKEW